jgi:hypothetical protein
MLANLRGVDLDLSLGEQTLGNTVIGEAFSFGDLSIPAKPEDRAFAEKFIPIAESSAKALSSGFAGMERSPKENASPMTV